MMQMILSIITVTGAICAAVFAYRTNVTSVNNSVMDLQKERISLLEKKQEEQETMIKGMTDEISTLHQKNNTYIEIFQNINPDMKSFMSLLTEVATQARDHMVFATHALEELLKKKK